MARQRIFDMKVSKIYPLPLHKVERNKQDGDTIHVVIEEKEKQDAGT